MIIKRETASSALWLKREPKWVWGERKSFISIIARLYIIALGGRRSALLVVPWKFISIVIKTHLTNRNHLHHSKAPVTLKLSPIRAIKSYSDKFQIVGSHRDAHPAVFPLPLGGGCCDIFLQHRGVQAVEIRSKLRWRKLAQGNERGNNFRSFPQHARDTRAAIGVDEVHFDFNWLLNFNELE